jgi:glc operon protein GlcG
MSKTIAAFLACLSMAAAADLPTKKVLNLAAVKTMVAAAEAEAAKRNVQVTICIVDASGGLLFFERTDSGDLNTIQFAQRKARHAALYRSPSGKAEEALKRGEVAWLAFPDAFPNRGGVPVQIDGQTIGGIAASGAASETDEAIAQAGADAIAKR